MNTGHRDVSSIFGEAIEIDSLSEREAYLARICGADFDLRRKVDQLINDHFRAGDFLDHGPWLDTKLIQTAGEELGSMIGRYKLQKRIGEGGMGTVYVAEQLQPVRREVALKVIKPGMDTRVVIRRFEAERQMLALMDDPYIAKVLDAGSTKSGRPYFVMELIRGIPITEYCDQEQLSLRNRLKLFVQVCQGVQHAHQKGIIHRDLKPANLLVCLRDGVPIPKVIDFGVAKAINQTMSGQTACTQDAQVIGTPMYMSPEQVDAKGLDIDTRSDVYALGVLLYEMITGVSPFEKESFAKLAYEEMRRYIREVEPLRPSQRIRALNTDVRTTVANKRGVDERQHLRSLRGDLDWIVMKAMEKDRARRYATADGLAADIQRYLDDQPIEASPPSASYRFRKFIWRNKTLLSVATSLLSAIVIICGVATSITYQQMQIARRLAHEKTELAISERKLRDVSNRQLAYSLFEQSDSKCVSNDAASGLLWLTRSLQRAHELGVEELDQPIRRQITGWSRHLHPVQLVFPHPQPVTIVDFSPDGKTVVTACDDQNVRLWDARTGQLRCPPLKHAGVIRFISYRPNEPGLVTVCSDRVVRFWNAQTGQQIRPELEHESEITKFALSPNGLRLVTGGLDANARLWNLETEEAACQLLHHESNVSCVGFSADGSKVITGTIEGTARIWNAMNGELLRPLLSHNAALSAAKISPNNQVALTTGLDRELRLWNAETGEPIGTPLPFNPHVEVADFSPDEQLILSSQSDRTVRIWDAATRNPVGQPLNHQARITAARFYPDSNRLLTAGMDWKVRLWDIATGQQIGSAINCYTGIRSATLSPDGQQILTGDEGGMARLWGVPSKPRQNISSPSTKPFDILEVSHREGKILTVDADGARLWDATTLQPLGELGNYPATDEFLGSVRHAIWSADDHRILMYFGHDASSTRIWNAETREPIGPTLKHQDLIYAVAFAPDGKTFAAGGEHHQIQFRDVQTQRLVDEVFTHPEKVTAIGYSPDGRILLTGSGDKKVRRWNLEKRTLIEPLLCHDGEVWATTFSPDGRMIITGSFDHTARFWDAETGAPIGLPLDHGDVAVQAVFPFPDGKMLMTVMGIKEMVLWNLPLKKPIKMPKVELIDLRCIGLRPDGNRLLIADRDRAIHSVEVPQPISGDVEQVFHWATVITGMELDENDTVRPLKEETWISRYRKLQKSSNPDLQPIAER